MSNEPMQAGRELDALVAEKVMKWVGVHLYHGSTGSSSYYIGRDLSGRMSVVQAHSTDLGAAWTALVAGSGVPVADRSYLGKTYPSCWVGAEAVDHLMVVHGLKRHDAWVLLHRLMQFGLIVHVTQSRPVIDGAFYYRFTGMPAEEGADPTEP